MNCPYCSYENINGSDQCVNCQQDLTALDQPTGQTPLEETLIHESLKALDPKPAIIVAPDTTVADAIESLCQHNIGCVLVGTQDRVVGIFSERDVLLRVAHQAEEAGSSPVSEFMTPDPEMLDLDTPMAFALNRMSLGDFRHLPVTERGRLKGVISLKDFLTFLNQWYPDLILAQV